MQQLFLTSYFEPAMKNTPSPDRWLVLLYQFPKGPDTRRVRMWRRLQRIGAVAIKNSVYVLPNNEQTQEDFQWLLADLSSNGADAAILESRFLDGMNDHDVRELFDAVRRADYEELRDEIETAIAALPAGQDGDHAETQETGRRALARARKRMAEIAAIDFFAAPGRDAAEAAMRTLAKRTTAEATDAMKGEETMVPFALENLKGRLWVTRRGVRVDRIASAWLIRSWIDPEARFKFVADPGYEPGEGEIRFDMFEAEFTHAGDQCTFEVLAGLTRPGDTALTHVGEIVHDIDLKDGKFGRPECDGIAMLLDGIVAGTGDDGQRIDRGCVLFDDLYRSLREHRA